MSWLSRLFGGRSDANPAPKAAGAEIYKEFAITPTPIREGAVYRVAARIEKDGKTHQLVRADTMASLDEATAFSLAKAKQMIDQNGDRMFG